jgi:predicted ATPase/class 3 adenylate cyclase/Tfp pilus assembly protein PilF
MREPRDGPITFLFSDIEGSTRLSGEYGVRVMKPVLARHDAIFEECLRRFGGRILDKAGDGVFAAFEGEGSPLECVLAIQRQIQAEDWGEIGELRIRVALHRGYAERYEMKYMGLTVNRTARVLSTGWGGQVLVTPEVLQAHALPAGASVEDLGVHLLKDLSEPQQILQLVHPDLKIKKFPALRSLSSRPNNLPPQSTPFIGREEELAKILAYLDDPACRLLTLLGPGGIGKTRLALQAAAQLIDAFQYGVYAVFLAPLSSADLIIPTIADALRFTFYSREDPKTQMINYLREKQLLLVLDNFEHVTAGAGLLAELLPSAPQVKLLVTSRTRLNLQGERLLDIHGMKFPQNGQTNGIEDHAAVRLFLQGARRVGAHLDWTQEQPHVVRICQLVCGVPLAIELAAAWTRALPCTEIAQEIQQSLDFLETSMADLPERHRSLRGAFEYSWKLLSEPERDAFSKLSVFRGGFTRSAAQRVTGASLLLLSALIDKSLLYRNASEHYEVHELLRQYGEERLKRDPQVYERTRDRHCAYYSEALQSLEGALKGAERKAALEKIQPEIDNVRAAWNWAVAHGPEGAIEKSLQSLYCFYELRSRYFEGQAAFEEAIAPRRKRQTLGSPAEPNPLLAKLLARQGGFCCSLGLHEQAKQLLEESLALCSRGGAREELAFILLNLGVVHLRFGEYQRAREFAHESLVICRAAGDPRGIADALNTLGNIGWQLGEYAQAKRFYQEGLAIRKETGDLWGLGGSLNNLGIIADQLGEYAEAKRLLTESLALSRQIGDRRLTGESLNNLGLTAEHLGELVEAKEFYQESLAIKREIGDRWSIGRSLNNLGEVTMRLGEYGEARRLLEESLAIKREVGDRRGYAWSLCQLSYALAALGDGATAKAHLRQALAVAVELKAVPVAAEALVGMAKFLAAEGEAARAVTLLSFVLHHPATGKELHDRARKQLSELEPALPQDEFTAAVERGQAAQLEELGHRQ